MTTRTSEIKAADDGKDVLLVIDHSLPKYSLGELNSCLICGTDCEGLCALQLNLHSNENKIKR
jgi:hypothetical protein